MIRLSDPYHPGLYALLLRTRVTERLEHYLAPQSVDRIKEMRRAADCLLRAGMISIDEYDEIRERILRKKGALLLRALRKNEAGARRISWVRRLRRMFPLGLSAYDIRMGRGVLG